MLEVDPRFRAERELINRIDQVIELFTCNWCVSLNARKALGIISSLLFIKC